MIPTYDNTITLGNLIMLLSMAGGFLLAWRDLNWRIKNVEIRSAEQLAKNMLLDALALKTADGQALLREAVAKLTAIVEGQDRRLTLLEQANFKLK